MHREGGESDQCKDDLHSRNDHHRSHKGDHWNVKCPQNDSTLSNTSSPKYYCNLSQRYLMPSADDIDSKICDILYYRMSQIFMYGI